MVVLTMYSDGAMNSIVDDLISGRRLGSPYADRIILELLRHWTNGRRTSSNINKNRGGMSAIYQHWTLHIIIAICCSRIPTTQAIYCSRPEQ